MQKILIIVLVIDLQLLKFATVPMISQKKFPLCWDTFASSKLMIKSLLPLFSTWSHSLAAQSFYYVVSDLASLAIASLPLFLFGFPPWLGTGPFLVHWPSRLRWLGVCALSSLGSCSWQWSQLLNQRSWNQIDHVHYAVTQIRHQLKAGFYWGHSAPKFATRRSL
jgi:hypothetical protein